MIKKNEHTFAVVAHGESPHLEECVRSLKGQTVKSKIYISTSTPSIFLSRISERYGMPVIVNGSGGGIASDWTFAYNSCETGYVTLAHQDDVYLPEYTESCLAAAEKKNGNGLIVFTGCEELLGSGRVNFSPKTALKNIFLAAFLSDNGANSHFLKRGMLSIGNPITCPSVMYNKALIGDFEFSREFLCNMDWDAWIRLSGEKGSFVYVSRKLIRRRIHDDSQMSALMQNNIKRKEDETVFRSFWPDPVARMLAGVYNFKAKPLRLKQGKALKDRC